MTTQTYRLLKRYQHPEQCCNCGSDISVSSAELCLVPILPPADGGTYKLVNWPIMCPSCREATLFGTDEEYETTERPPDAKRATIFELDDCMCVACGEAVDPAKKGEPQIHHVRPRGREGRNRLSNMVTMHKLCHNALTNRQKMKHFEQIRLGQAKRLLGRAGNELQEIEMFREWMLPEHPPFEALKVYKEQYHQLDSLIEHYRHMPFPTVGMDPLIGFLETLQTTKEAKYKHVALYHKRRAKEMGDPIPEQLREITP